MDGDIIPTQIIEHQNNNTIPQIDGFTLGETLGQGSFGIIKSASLNDNHTSSAVVAIKFIDLVKCKRNGIKNKTLYKEVLLHSQCSNHPNILNLLDYNIKDDYLYLILEMADGGDLFDKIEPDIGVDNDVAQFYFQQLVNAISFLHNDHCIAHRDIKPENILLDRYGNLKLADFGLAAKFKNKDGTLKHFYDAVGSPPYMAPEIFTSSKSNRYLANLTDIWSIGIFVFVLLTGEIPWQLPVEDDSNFQTFINNKGNVISSGPWCKINLTHLNLLRKLLQFDPVKRLTIDDLHRHPWYYKPNKFANSKKLCKDPYGLAKALMSNLKVYLTDETFDTLMTQDPLIIENSLKWKGENFGNKNHKMVSTQPLQSDIANLQTTNLYDPNPKFTQFQNLDNNILFNTQYEASYIPKNAGKKWLDLISNDVTVLQFVKNEEKEEDDDDTVTDKYENVDLRFKPFNLTKFYSLESMDKILSFLENSLHLCGIPVKPDLFDSYLKFLDKSNDIKKIFPLQINIKTVDRRFSTLTGSILIDLINNKLKALEFQRKKGDPLEWRRLFKKIAVFCKDIILIPDGK